MTNPWLNQPACDPFPTEGAATMSDRPGPRSVMSQLDRLLIDGGKHYTTADRIYAEVIAPLLAEAERRGAERGWKRGVRDTIDVRPWSSPLDSDNPYLEGK